MPQTLYAIIDTSEIGAYDFLKFKQDSSATCRKSLDQSKSLISFNALSITNDLFSGTMITERTFESKEIYGPSGDTSLLTGVLESIPFASTLVQLAYSGVPKKEIKDVARGALDSGIINKEDIPPIKRGLIRYSEKNNDSETDLKQDFFVDVTGVKIGNQIVFDENNQKIKNKHYVEVQSGDYEIKEEYRIQSDQYFNLSSIKKYKTQTKYRSNVDHEGNILHSQLGDNGQFVTGIKYYKKGCIGPIANNIQAYNKEQVIEILNSYEWSDHAPEISSVTPSSGGFGDSININGNHFANVTGIKLGDYEVPLTSTGNNNLSIALPQTCSDGNIEFLGKYSNTQTAKFFDYINELPTLDAVEVNLDNEIILYGSRLDNVKFVNFAPDWNEENFRSSFYEFTTQFSTGIVLPQPESLTGSYSITLTDIEDRLVL